LIFFIFDLLFSLKWVYLNFTSDRAGFVPIYLQDLHKRLPIDILEWISNPSNFWIVGSRSKKDDGGG